MHCFSASIPSLQPMFSTRSSVVARCVPSYVDFIRFFFFPQFTILPFPLWRCRYRVALLLKSSFVLVSQPMVPSAYLVFSAETREESASGRPCWSTPPVFSSAGFPLPPQEFSQRWPCNNGVLLHHLVLRCPPNLVAPLYLPFLGDVEVARQLPSFQCFPHSGSELYGASRVAP